MDPGIVLLLVVGGIAMFYMIVSIIEAYFTLKERYIDRVLQKIGKDKRK